MHRGIIAIAVRHVAAERRDALTRICGVNFSARECFRKLLESPFSGFDISLTRQNMRCPRAIAAEVNALRCREDARLGV